MRHALRPRSIAFRLIVAVLAVELLSSILVVVLAFGYERHAHFRAFDVMLHGRADSIFGAVQDAEDPADNVMLDKADLHLPPEDIYEVRDAGGNLLGRSGNWDGNGDGASAAPKRPARGHGRPDDNFTELTIGGRQYRALHVIGSRTVDPGEAGGGKVRQVSIVYGSPTSRVWQSIAGAVEFYASGSVVLLLVTGPLIAWLLHRGLLPLRELATLASQVSVDAWHFDPPESARSTPELAPLTLALESVLQRLEHSFQQQRAFIGDAAHELKTAVAVQKSSLQLLSMKPRSTLEYQAGLERCLSDSLRLESLVADMLTLARAESSTPVSSTRATADIAECVRRAADQLENVAAYRNVQLVVALSPPATAPLSVAIAADDCVLLVSNLLLNAVQHSAPGGTVSITAAMNPAHHGSHAGATVQLQVKDHGDGIAAEAQPYVFDRFYRGDPSRARSTGGTGLGLSICKAIVHKAGGSIHLDSRVAEPSDTDTGSQGTTVTVLLPALSIS